MKPYAFRAIKDLPADSSLRKMGRPLPMIYCHERDFRASVYETADIDGWLWLERQLEALPAPDPDKHAVCCIDLESVYFPDDTKHRHCLNDHWTDNEMRRITLYFRRVLDFCQTVRPEYRFGFWNLGGIRTVKDYRWRSVIHASGVLFPAPYGAPVALTNDVVSLLGHVTFYDIPIIPILTHRRHRTDDERRKKNSHSILKAGVLEHVTDTDNPAYIARGPIIGVDAFREQVRACREYAYGVAYWADAIDNDGSEKETHKDLKVYMNAVVRETSALQK